MKWNRIIIKCHQIRKAFDIQMFFFVLVAKAKRSQYIHRHIQTIAFTHSLTAFTFSSREAINVILADMRKPFRILLELILFNFLCNFVRAIFPFHRILINWPPHSRLSVWLTSHVRYITMQATMQYPGSDLLIYKSPSGK